MGLDFSVIVPTFDRLDVLPEVLDAIEAQETEARFELIVVDGGSRLAKEFGATRTPHIYVFDADGKLVYVGAIDDNARDAGAVTKTYLRDALDALEMLARAQAAAPDSPEPPYRMAEILISLGGTDHLTAARDHLRQAIALGADEADAYFRLMQVHIDLNHIPAAQDAYTQAVQRDPENTRLREWGIRLALLRGDLGAALAQAERELASAPENYHWQRWVADLRLQTGDAAGARAMFDALIAAHLPADLPAEDWFAAQWGAILVSRADACRRVGDLDAASAPDDADFQGDWRKVKLLNKNGLPWSDPDGL